MNSDIYRALMEEYRALREQDRRIEAERENEVFSAHPDIEKMCRERHEKILLGISGILTGSEGAGLEKDMARRSRFIGDRLEACGYPRDYLQPVYACPECRDTGYVGDVVKQECACLKRRLREMEAGSGAGEASFERFDLSVFPEDLIPEKGTTQRKYMEAVKLLCLDFAEKYPKGRRNLLLHGSTGLGKTYLLKCIAARLRDRGIDTVYVTAFRLLDDLRNACFRPGSRDTGMYFDSGLLIVDDLGMEPLFDNVTVEMLLNVMNERTERQQGIAVSTNLDRTQLKERYTERFFSRLMDKRASLVIPFYGRDVRLI